jgi:DNA-binding Lrp family transcriptional regulator
MDDILKILKDNARESIDNIATMLDKSVEDIKATIRTFEDDGVIKGYQAILDEDKLDSELVNAVIEVKVIPEREGGFDHIASRIANFPEVVSMYLMSGVSDLMVFVQGDNIRDVATFVSEKLSTIPGVTGTSTHFTLKTYKYRGVIMGEPDERERLKVSP